MACLRQPLNVGGECGDVVHARAVAGHDANTPANHLDAIRWASSATAPRFVLIEAQTRRVASEGGGRGYASRGCGTVISPTARPPALGACAVAGVDASATSGAAGRARSAITLFNDRRARGNSDPPPASPHGRNQPLVRRSGNGPSRFERQHRFDRG